VPAYLASSIAASHSGVLLSGALPLLTTVLRSPGSASGSTHARLGLAVIMAGMALLGLASLSGAAPRLARRPVVLAGASSGPVFTVLVRRWSVGPWDAAAITNVLSATSTLPIYVLVPRRARRARVGEVASALVIAGVPRRLTASHEHVKTARTMRARNNRSPRQARAAPLKLASPTAP